MNKIKAFLSLLIGSVALFSCGNNKASFYTFDGTTLTVKIDSGTYTIQPYSKEIIKVSYSDAQIGLATSSHAVVLPMPKDLATIIEDTESTVTLRTDALTIKVSTKPFNIEFFQHDAMVLQGGKAFVSDTTRGFTFQLQPKEAIYGGGERAVPMNRRGYRFDLYNAPHYGYEWGADRLNYSVPVLASSNQYMLLYDNPQKGYMDIGKKQADQLELGSIGGSLDYYFIGGSSFAGLCEQYTALTGRQDLPPRWAFGYLLSRFGYKTQEETIRVFDEMQKAGFPIDAVILDLYWFGSEVQGTLGNLDWHAPNWPDPKAMIDYLKSKNVQTILITEPFVIKNTLTFDDGDAQKIFALDDAGNTFIDTNFYFGNAGLIDIFKPEAQDWFWEKYKKQIDLGVGGWWGDLGEPEHHPEGMVHANGKANEVHNIYGHYWDKMLYERYAKEYPDTRLFNLNRSGFAGSQRYSIFPWTGDVSRSWSGLKSQTPLMLTMGMNGLGYIHSDLGGFTPGKQDGELYLRWLQMGVFNPIFRPHSSELPSEPIYYDKEVTKIAKDLVNLRFRLLPYNYSTAWQNASKGLPLARPLFFEDATDEQLRDNMLAYMWGDNFLVAPVVEGGLDKMEVYLPKGKWFSFWNDEVYEGGKSVEQTLSIEKIPVFVKAGAFIPMSVVSGNTSTYDASILTLHYYPSATVPNSSFELYEDDGATKQAYKKGKYELLNFNGIFHESGIEIKLAKSGAGYKDAPKSRQMTLIVHGIANAKTVMVGEDELQAVTNMEQLGTVSKGSYWNKATQQLYIKFSWDGGDLVVGLK